MEEDDTGQGFHGRLDGGLAEAKSEVAVVDEEGVSLFVVPSVGILSRGAGYLIEGRIDARDDEKEAHDEERESFKKAVHDNNDNITMKMVTSTRIL
jgi:hypothetical protein